MIDNRRAARKGCRLARLAATAAVFLALAPAARAQGLFNFFGGGPDPYDIERRLDASGYTLTGPLMRRGNVYLADVVAGRHDYERLIIDAQTGRIVQRFRNRPHWMDEQADTWGGAPRPPGDVDLAPPRDLFAREEPNTDLSDKPKPKPHEAKHKTTPGPVASAPPASAQASEPTPAATPSSAPVAATPPSPTPSAASAAPAASPSPTTETSAKIEDAPAAQSSPAPAPTTSAAAPTTAVAAKSAEPSEPRKKAVNDLPVTPLD
jgi:hypothetical protein